MPKNWLVAIMKILAVFGLHGGSSKRHLWTHFDMNILGLKCLHGWLDGRKESELWWVGRRTLESGGGVGSQILSLVIIGIGY